MLVREEEVTDESTLNIGTLPFREIVSGLQGNLSLANPTHAVQEKLSPRFAFSMSW